MGGNQVHSWSRIIQPRVDQIKSQIRQILKIRIRKTKYNDRDLHNVS